jgi:hypothetical protein
LLVIKESKKDKKYSSNLEEFKILISPKSKEKCHYK